MPNQFLKLRRSAIQGKIPDTSSLDLGELAINTFDGQLFLKKSGSEGELVTVVGSTGSFTGSFTGNGAGLNNIPASGITGLNLSRIATGSVTASVNTDISASFRITSGSNTLLNVTRDGFVWIGNGTFTNQAYQLDVQGTARTTGNVLINRLNLQTDGKIWYNNIWGERWAINLAGDGDMSFTSTKGSQSIIFRGESTYTHIVASTNIPSSIYVGKFEGREGFITATQNANNGNYTTGTARICAGYTPGTISPSATNTNGVTLYINPANGGGSGLRSDIIFQTVDSTTYAPNETHQLIDRWWIKSNTGTLSNKGTASLAVLDVSGSSIFTGSVLITGSTVSLTGGSFSGSGANLYDIPASGITGLNLSRIATGSITASVSPDISASFRLTSGSNTLLNIARDGKTWIGSGTYANAGYQLDVISGDARINGVNVGLGAGSVNGNTVLGLEALKVNSGIAGGNTGLGYRTLWSNVTGVSNTAVGFDAMLFTNGGGNNTAVGNSAGRSMFGNQNVAIGGESMRGSTSGDANTAVGYQSLNASGTGTQNTALGSYALLATTNGGFNTALGSQALSSNATGSNNVAVGYQALYSAGDPFRNIAIGSRAGFALTTGQNNIQIGYYALPAGDGITVGSFNTIIGGQISGLASSTSNNIILADGQGNIKYQWDTIRNNFFGNTGVSGSLFVSSSITASNALITGTLTAQTLVVQTVTSSIVFSSGSNTFGNNQTNLQQFTGSVLITGSTVSLTGGSFSGSGANLYEIPASGITGLNLSRIATGSISASVNTDISSSFRLTSGSNTLLNVTREGLVWIGNGTFTNQAYQLDVQGTTRVNGILTNTDSYYQIPNNNGLQIGFFSNSTPGTKSNISITNSGTGGSGTAQVFPIMNGLRNIYIVGTDVPSGIGSPIINGSDNLIIGRSSINNPIGGSSNILIYSRGQISVGSGNTGIGLAALNGITSGSNNLHLTIGNGAGNGSFTSTLSDSIYIGDPVKTNNYTTVAGDIVIATTYPASTQFWFGGKSDATDVYFNSPAQIGTNQTGAIQYWRASIGTGTGIAGKTIFQHSIPTTSGTTIHSVFTNTLTLETNRVSVSGSFILNGTQFNNTSSVTVAGITTVSQLSTSSYTSCFYNYTVASASNARSGQVMTVWNGNNIVYTEVVTTDIGNTSPVAVSASLSSGFVRLQVSASSGWTFKNISNLL